VTNTSSTTIATNWPVGEYFFLPPGACDVAIVRPQLTNYISTTNVISVSTNSIGTTTNGTAVIDVVAGKLRFMPAANANDTPYAGIGFQVQDDGGTANGGVDLDPSPNTLTINVQSANDAPSGTSTTVTTLEDTP
jgi:hypothetical protein